MMIVRTVCLKHDHTRVNEYPHGVGGCADCNESLQHSDHADCPRGTEPVRFVDRDLFLRTRELSK